MVARWDSVWIDFSKGLGAPLGAVLAGARDFIDEVWRWKQRLGGSLRQAGICAAACHYALDHNVDRLADDHANARRLASGLADLDGIGVQAPETNLVFFDVCDAGITNEELTKALRQRGVLVSIMGGRMRACTHLDISADLIQETLDITRDILHGRAQRGIRPRRLSVAE
jgi:threonine aldolase